jgi:arylsulfatase A-like enzyme
MNVIWIVADTFRQDHLGAYGKMDIRTPSLDALAARSVRYDRHHAAGFPTMPTRADHATGRWTMSFMGWEPLPDGATTLAQLLSESGAHTAAMIDTPFYVRGGMNYDRGYQTFSMYTGQEGSATRLIGAGHHESRDARAAWRFESDRNVAQTMTRAMRWLQLHHKEEFFLYVDTWDPHEPWDAPDYYTEAYWPGYDGEVIQPVYGHLQDAPGYTEELVRKAHATYCGEVTMVDTWVGYLLRQVENMGLMENTAVIFTSDHGFYFGEHGGLFGKLTFMKGPDGSLYQHGDPDARWDFSPLYQELTLLPLLVYVPGAGPGSYGGLTSAIDLMPTVLDIMGRGIPDWVQGRSLLKSVRDRSTPGREYAITTVPFANPGDLVRSVDNIRRMLARAPVTTVTVDQWALLDTVDEGLSELYHLPSDPGQQRNVILDNPGVARDVHEYLVRFMRETSVPEHLLNPRRELRI